MKNQFLIIILSFAGIFSLSAQSISYNNGYDNFLRLEFNKPIFGEGFDTKFFNFDAFLNGEFRIGEKGKIAIEIPFSRIALTGFFQDFNETNLGNLGFAYQFRNLENRDYFEIKLGIPTAGDGGLLLANFTERIAAGIPDLFSIRGSYNLESRNLVGWYGRFRPGAEIWIPANDDTIVETEFLLRLNVLGGYRNEKIDVNAGITTLIILSEDDIDLQDRILRQFLTSFALNFGSWKPGVSLRLPLGTDLLNTNDLVIGVNVGYTFGGRAEDVPQN